MANPFGMKGDLDLDAFYKIDAWTVKLAIDSSGDATTTASVVWNMFKSIEILFFVEYKLLDDPLSITKPMGQIGAGKFGFSARWLASFTDSGVELAQDGVQPRMKGSSKSDGTIVVAASARLAESKPGAKTPFVEMIVDIVAGDEDSGIQVGLSKGPVSVGTSSGGSKSGRGEEVKLRLNLDMARPEVPVRVVVDKIPPSLLAPEPILFEDEDQNTMSPRSISDLHKWVDKVKDHQYLGAVIAEGTVPIKIQAFASTTGSAAYNKQKTDQRLAEVMKILKNSSFFGSSKLKFDKQSHGKGGAEGIGAKYGFNRRVEIMIDHNKAKRAGEELLGGK